jgi:hypothetical protein
MIVLRFKSYVNKKSYISCVALILEPLGSDLRPFFKNLQCTGSFFPTRKL